MYFQKSSLFIIFLSVFDFYSTSVQIFSKPLYLTKVRWPFHVQKKRFVERVCIGVLTIIFYQVIAY